MALGANGLLNGLGDDDEGPKGVDGPGRATLSGCEGGREVAGEAEESMVPPVVKVGQVVLRHAIGNTWCLEAVNSQLVQFRHVFVSSG